MDWTALLKATAICFISIIIEAISASKDGKQWFENLKRPAYSFSLQFWYVVGAVYYLFFGFIAYRLFALEMSFTSTPVILLLLIMLLNGLVNFIAFKYRSLKWFYLILYPFSILVMALIVLLLSIDTISALLACIYFLWLLYDLYYAYHLWKLNKQM